MGSLRARDFAYRPLRARCDAPSSPGVLAQRRLARASIVTWPQSSSETMVRLWSSSAWVHVPPRTRALGLPPLNFALRGTLVVLQARSCSIGEHACGRDADRGREACERLERGRV